MFRYTIILKVTSIIEGIEFTAYPVIIRTTNTKDRNIVEQAAVHRFIRENWGSLTDAKVCRTSVEKVKEVA
jgi:hypothetical protein